MIFKPYSGKCAVVDAHVRVKVLHTPGHTPESVCLVVTDRRRAPDPWFVLTGDTLFVGPPKPVEMERILLANQGRLEAAEP